MSGPKKTKGTGCSLSEDVWNAKNSALSLAHSTTSESSEEKSLLPNEKCAVHVGEDLPRLQVAMLPNILTHWDKEGQIDVSCLEARRVHQGYFLR
ncbi:MAG: hypothetical protein NUV54_03045 [Candidatus Taylorbacteria bacterium]|nr:hypothetical protein [Candidatus Taylorbacteria bacterium]